MLLQSDQERLDGGGEVLRVEQGQTELAVDRSGLRSRFRGDLVVFQSGLHLSVEPGQVAEVLEEEGVGRRAGRLAQAEPRPFGVAARVVDERERVQERGVLDTSLLGPRLDVLQEPAGLFGERLRVVAEELLEPLGESVRGKPLAERLETLASLAAEEEALGRLVLLRLAGHGLSFRVRELQVVLGRGEPVFEVGGLLPERVALRRHRLQLAAEPRLFSFEETRFLLEPRDLPG